LHAALFELLFEHHVELAANPIGINALPQHLPRFATGTKRIYSRTYANVSF